MIGHRGTSDPGMHKFIECLCLAALPLSTFRIFHPFHTNTRTFLGVVAMSTEPPSAYELLGVSQDARDEEINKAFRQRSLKVHPDRNPDNPEAGMYSFPS